MIDVNRPADDPREIEAAVDEDIAEFDRYQQRYLKNWDPATNEHVGIPLTGHERSLIKTYLAHKLGIGPGHAALEEEKDG